MTKSTVEQRITRLVGDGKLSGAGALPIPDAFRGTMEEILDNGKATYQEIVKRITDEMHSKEKRVFGIFGSWESLTDDVLAQLLSHKLIRPEHDPDEDLSKDQSWMKGMFWLLGEQVVTQKHYDVITKSEVRKATGNPDATAFRVMLFDAEARYERDRDAKALTAVRKLSNELERLDRMDEQTSRILDNLVARIEGKKEAVERAPFRLPDQPETIMYCKFGGEPRALTHENFDQYLSRGKKYWRVICKEHMPSSRTQGTNKRRQLVKETVERYIRMEDGKIPSAREVAHRLGFKDDRSVRADWDVLTAAGDLPPRKSNNLISKKLKPRTAELSEASSFPLRCILAGQRGVVVLAPVGDPA